jgi:hypothetical protein
MLGHRMRTAPGKLGVKAIACLKFKNWNISSFVLTDRA